MNRVFFRSMASRPYFAEICLGMIVGAYLLLKFLTLEITTGDEGVYYYASSLWLNGSLPYRDFFFSHPPIHLLVSMAAIKIFGINFKILSAIPAVLGAISGVLTFLIGKRISGKWCGLIACTLFLFAHVQLFESSHFTGINLSVSLMLLAILLHLKNKDLISGIIFGLGSHAGVYTGIGFLLLLCVTFKKREGYKELLTGFVISFIGIFLLFTLLTGKAFFEQVFLYHLSKSSMEGFFASKLTVISQNIAWHPILIILSIAGIFCFHHMFQNWKRGRDDTSSQTIWILIMSITLLIGYGIFLLLFQRVFHHYFLLLLPFASILGAYAIAQMCHAEPLVSAPLRSGQAETKHRISHLIIIILFLHIGLSLKTYSDEERQKVFESARVVGQVVRESITPDQSIYGNFAITPTISYLSGRRIAAREIDSSAMRFESGISDLGEVIEAIEADNVGAILSQSVGGIGNYPPFREYMEKKFKMARTFKQILSNEDLLVEVWLRN